MNGLKNFLAAVAVLGITGFAIVWAQNNLGVQQRLPVAQNTVPLHQQEPIQRSADVTIWQAAGNGGIAGFFTQIGVGDPVCDPASMSESQLRRMERRGGPPRRCPREYDAAVDAYFRGLSR